MNNLYVSGTVLGTVPLLHLSFQFVEEKLSKIIFIFLCSNF